MANTDLVAGNLPTTTPQVWDYKNTGTAAATATLSTYPCVLHSVTITERKASGAVVIYDSAGTSATVIGSIVCGTHTGLTDPPATYLFDVRTKTALSVVNTADLGAVVSYGR